MLKRKVLKGGHRRNTIESDDDEDFLFDEGSPSSTDTTTVAMDIEEPFSKRPRGTKKQQPREKSMTAQFLDSFLTNFSVDELAAKHTVETIYGSSGSFSYTFRCLEDTILGEDSNKDLVLSFIKALAAVADERLLQHILGGGVRSKKTKGVPVVTADTSTAESYEFLLIGTVKKLKDLIFIDDTAHGWKKIMSYAKCLLLSGLSREIRTLMSSFFGERDMTAEVISSCLDRFRSVISTVGTIANGASKHSNSRQGSAALGISDCGEVIDQIKDILKFLSQAQCVVATTIANRTESEGIAAMVEAIELELGIAGTILSLGNGEADNNNPSPSSGVGVDSNSPSGDSGEDIEYKIECVKLLLSDDCCTCLSDADLLSESDFLRQKLDHMCQSFEEQRRRQKEQQAELARKCKLKRDSVTYVLTRLSESESPNAPAYIRHPFYILGLPPSKCKEDVLRKWGRKLKTLLHPDTEHDPEWKSRAEQAFKEASIALEKCATIGANIPNYGNVRLAAQPPYACFIGLVSQSESEQQPGSTSVTSSDNVIEPPTLTLQPSFNVSCTDTKSGGINISLEPSIFNMNGFKKLGPNKHIMIYMHRPTHGDEPTALRIHQNLVYGTKKVSLPESTNGKYISIKLDAVQPIVFGCAWKYFVGVQVVGDLGASLVSWKGIYIELASKGRTAAHVGKLLATFEGANFVNQSLLQSHLTRCREGSKVEAEGFLIDCAKAAQRWADAQ